MKSLKIAVIAALLAASPALAQAQDAGPMPYYVQAMGGVDISRDLSLVGGPLDDRLETKMGYAFGVAAGWRPFDNDIRVELEYMHRADDASRFTNLASNFGIDSATGSLSIDTAMVNALIDWPISPAFVPYAGVGLGWAGAALKNVSASFITVDGKDDLFAVQGIVGAATPIAERVAAFVDARLLIAPKAAQFTVTPGAFPAQTHLRNISVMAGVRFSFGG
jgi:opacity protein-like surface antigen